jgi:hypothetical protein
VRLDELNVIALGYFKGNIWEGQAKASMALFLDERADEKTAGSAADDLRRPRWRLARSRISSATYAGWNSRTSIFTSTRTPPGKRVQVYNAGGCETGPGGVATYGKSTADKADAFGFKWDRKGWSSKHIGFDWSGPDA